VLIATGLVFGLFVIAEVLTFGQLVVDPPEIVTLHWANLYFNSTSEAPGFVLMLLGFVWVVTTGIAYIVYRRIAIFAITGLVVQALFTAKLSPQVLIDFHGTSFTATSLYWVSAAALVLLFRSPGFISPFRTDDRSWQAVIGFLGIGTIGLIFGLSRGNSGFFEYAAYLDFVVAFYIAYLAVKIDGPIKWFIPALLGIATLRALWGYGLLITNSGRTDTGGWGGLGLTTPDLAILSFPLLIGFAAAVASGSVGLISGRVRVALLTGAPIIIGIVALPVLFSVQRSHWAALAVGLLALTPIVLLLPVRKVIAGVVIAVIVGSTLGIPAVMSDDRDSFVDAANNRIQFSIDELRPGSGYSRSQDLENARSAIARNPVLGDGLGVFYYYTFDPRGDRPSTEGELNSAFHMSSIRIAATTGILGVVVLVSMFLVPYVSAIRLAFSGAVSRSDSVILVGVSSVLLVALTYFSIDLWFPHSWRTGVMGVVMGGVVGMISWYRNGDRSRTLPTASDEG
jgi:hypothetical protein